MRKSIWFFFPGMEEISTERWVIAPSERVKIVNGFGRAETKFGIIACTQEHGYVVPSRYQNATERVVLRRQRKRIRAYISARTPEDTIRFNEAAINGLELAEDPPLQKEIEEEV